MSELPSHEVEIDPAAFLPEGVVFETRDEVDPADHLEGELGDGDDADQVDDAIDPAADADADAEGESDGGDETAKEGAGPSIDLDALRQIELDLDGVDAAIAALDAGTYGTDPASGTPIDDALLAEDPTRLS